LDYFCNLMAQVNWVYLDDCGGQHRIGLYHGDRSGHLMIHCNRRVMQVDFSVLESITYSFFVEDELCEVILEKMKDGRFGYEFRVNKTVDTPRNQIRRIDHRRNKKLLTLVILGVVATILLLFLGLLQYGQSQDIKKMSQTSIVHNLSKSKALKLARKGLTTTAFLHIEVVNAQKIGVYSFKTADSSEIRGVFPVADTGLVLLQNGFPLRAGDAFEARYLPTDPQIHRVELFRPTHSTVSNYINQALEVEQRVHPLIAKEVCLCRVLTAAQWQNWLVLADFIFQEKPAEVYPHHNRETFLRLMQHAALQKMLEEGCH
jgi:hypothetical protein